MKKGKKKEGLRITRRQFLKGAAATGIGMALPLKFGIGKAYAFSQSINLQKFLRPIRSIGGAAGVLPGNQLQQAIPLAASDGKKVYQYFDTNTTTYKLAVLPANTIPPVGYKEVKINNNPVTHYTINIGEFQDELHPNLYTGSAGTRLWGYNPVNPDGTTPTPRHLGGVIVTKKGVPVQITFRNNLPNQHIIPIDATIPGAYVGAGSLPSGTQGIANRTATHLHGGLVPWVSDGGPHDWWNPSGEAGLSFQNDILNQNPGLNEAEYYYPNGQSARLVWYHDHAWGITRINAYAGVASGYVIYDDFELSMVAAPNTTPPNSKLYGNLPGPAASDTFYLVFQDKIFVDSDTKPTTDPNWPVIGTKAGDLWYAHIYDPARWVVGPGTPPTPTSVIPEFFGDTILVNGTVYPYIEVDRTQYRFRLLNACNARFLNPRLVYAQGPTFPANTEPNPNAQGPGFIQFGTEGGFLPAPVNVNGKKQLQLLLAPAERADLLVDFSAVPAGSVLILYNDAPAPFPKGDARNDYYPGNPKTPTSIPGFGPNTRTLLQIRVTNNTVTKGVVTLPTGADFAANIDTPLVPQTVGVPTPNPTGVPVRYLTLNEAFDAYGRLIQYLGTNQAVNPGAKALLFGREYMANASEVIAAGATEVWEIANLTADVHPIHFHLVNVQILSRQPFQVKTYAGGIPNYLGPAVAPDANELGWKETVRMNPGEVTRVIMRFDLPAVPFTVPYSPRTTVDAGNNAISKPNEYVWHCHILEHEEHDMMRPLVVTGDSTVVIMP